MIGRRPHFAFGNSTGDRQMLEYTKAGTAPGSQCSSCTTTPRANTPMGPPRACPTPKSARFPQELYEKAKKDGWIVVSMKTDWKRIFAFE